jgi:hypothetical protein
MKRLLLPIVVLLGLTGCAPYVDEGNQNSVIVKRADSEEAFDLAADHCEKYGRTARLRSVIEDDSDYMFDCIE